MINLMLSSINTIETLSVYKTLAAIVLIIWFDNVISKVSKVVIELVIKLP